MIKIVNNIGSPITSHLPFDSTIFFLYEPRANAFIFLILWITSYRNWGVVMKYVQVAITKTYVRYM